MTRWCVVFWAGAVGLLPAAEIFFDRSSAGAGQATGGGFAVVDSFVGIPSPLSSGTVGSGPTAGHVLTIQAVGKPSLPVTPTPVVGSATGLRSPAPTLSGTAVPGSTVTIFDGGTPIGTATADGTGSWTWTPSPPLSPGHHRLTVAATAVGQSMSVVSGPVLVQVPSGSGTGSGGGSGGGGGGGCGAGLVAVCTCLLFARGRQRSTHRGALGSTPWSAR